MNLKDRIKLVRQKEGKNQTEFGAKIGVSGAAVSRWEAGDRAIPDSAIRSICREFNINEKWLREGTEPMKAENSTAAEISEAVRRVLSDKPESFQSALITVLMRFEEEGNQWHVLEEIFDRVTEEMKQRQAENAKKP